MNGTLYHHLVGSLNYLTITRPYIAYLFNILIQSMAKTHGSNWKTTKIVLQYFKGTKIVLQYFKEIVNFGIEHSNDLNVKLRGYSNSYWARDHDDRKSTIG